MAELRNRDTCRSAFEEIRTHIRHLFVLMIFLILIFLTHNFNISGLDHNRSHNEYCVNKTTKACRCTRSYQTCLQFQPSHSPPQTFYRGAIFITGFLTSWKRTKQDTEFIAITNAILDL